MRAAPTILGRDWASAPSYPGKSFATTGVASPWDADDTTYFTHTNDGDGDNSTLYAVDAMPGDFVTMDDNLEYALTCRLRDAAGGDVYSIRLRIMDGATVLAAADAGGTFQGVTGVVDNTDQTTSSTFTYTNQTANAAAWANADAQTQQTHIQNKGPDRNAIQVDHVTIGGGSSAYTGSTA